MTAGERLGVRVLQGRGETTGHRPRVRWVMAVGGVVVGGMTACRTVAAAAIVVTLLLVMKRMWLLGGHERTGRGHERND